MVESDHPEKMKQCEDIVRILCRASLSIVKPLYILHIILPDILQSSNISLLSKSGKSLPNH